jgi:hypothetical protein
MVVSIDEHRLRLSPEQPDQNPHLEAARKALDSINEQLPSDGEEIAHNSMGSGFLTVRLPLPVIWSIRSTLSALPKSENGR